MLPAEGLTVPERIPSDRSQLESSGGLLAGAIALASLEPPVSECAERPAVRGKFIFRGNTKTYVKGVTYGPFRPAEDGCEYHTAKKVDQDFARMAATGINAVRTYTVPPLWLLDLAFKHGISVMIGLPWEQHIAFLEDRRRPDDIERRVRAGVRACAGHPAVLCYSVGNEIPASIVRWHGKRRVESFIERLYRAAKEEDPGALVTYVNYPTTEYLQLPFIDLVCFNVFLESKPQLEAYVARLQNLAGERPLVLTEIGLDGQRHGEETQAQALEEQIQAAFAGGCAGSFVFSWTDEWHRGGCDIKEWSFGITDQSRNSKPALAAVQRAYAEAPFRAVAEWPRISVVVCTHNGNRTIRDCLEGLLRLSYPDYEVIVVDDGSTDATAEAVAEYPFKLIRTENRGLSAARNTGLEAATGQLVAYLDDDAYPDEDWLTYLAAAFRDSKYAGIGGPNIAPPDGGMIADCVANAPGGPVHVLLTDREAEHIPGCNMAFRRSALESIGGFDPQFWVAGDDVDLCWRLQQAGHALGFCPAAVVWHYRRNSVRTYWKQQKGYGKAEAMLEKKWPEKYNGAGQAIWGGRTYGKGVPLPLGWAGRIYHGTWGMAPFQSLYSPASGSLWALLLMPEWYLVISALAGISVLGLHWRPLLYNFPLFIVATVVTLCRAGRMGAAATVANYDQTLSKRFALKALTAGLHLIQPAARLWGRLRHGLTPSRLRGAPCGALPRSRKVAIWSKGWRPAEWWLKQAEAAIRSQGRVAIRGGGFDAWDLEVRGGGILGAVRLRMAIEEHGAGTQLVRFRIWPICSPAAVLAVVTLLALATGAALDRAATPCTILAISGLVLAIRTGQECAAAVTAAIDAAEKQQDLESEPQEKAPEIPDKVPQQLAVGVNEQSAAEAA